MVRQFRLHPYTLPVGRGNKYNVGKKEDRTYAGVVYHSILEARYAAQLDLRLQAGDIVAWRRQVPVKLVVNDHLITTYRIDFQVSYPDGRVRYVEIKGHETSEWKLKMKLLEALRPDIHAVLEVVY